MPEAVIGQFYVGSDGVQVPTLKEEGIGEVIRFTLEGDFEVVEAVCDDEKRKQRLMGCLL